MELNLLLVCVGLVICFGGIYFRKICAGIMGLIWGALLGVVIVVMMALSSGGIWGLMYSSEDSSSMMIVIIAAIVVCALSAWLDKLCAAINAFLSSFFVILMIACLFAEDIDALSGIIIISVILAGCLAVAAYVYYNYAFILVTAFSGAYIASLGGVGLIADGDLSEVLYSLFLNGDSEVASIVMVSTIILGCIGCFVQMKRLKQTSNPEIQNADAIDVTGKNINLDQINVAAGKVADGAKKVGEAASPYLSDIGNQFKTVWDELNTEQGRSNLKDTIASYKMLFIAPVLQFLLIPIIYRLLNSVVYINAIFEIVYWISVVAEAASVGILAYVVITKDTKFNMIYQLPYLIGYIVFNFTYFEYYTGVAVVVYIFKFLITWLVLYVVAKLIKKNEIKPLVLLIVAFIMYYFVINWLAYFYVSFYMDVYTIVKLIVCIVAGYIAFKKYHGINVFDFKMASVGFNNSVPNSTFHTNSNVKYRCSKCNKLFNSEANFCDQCGGAVLKICGHCGNKVNANDVFCKECGKHL